MNAGLKIVATCIIILNGLCFPLCANGVIRFVYFDQFEPLSWKENGQMKGVFIDAVNEVFKTLEIDVIHEGYPWKRAQLLVQSGQADAMCTVSKKERLVYTVPTSYPIVQMEFKIFTSSKNKRLDALQKVESISDLKGFRLIDIRGSGWAESHLKGMNLEYESTYPMIFKLLDDGLYDASIRNNIQTKYLIKKFGFKGKIIDLPQSIMPEQTAYRILISKKSTYANQLGKINDALRTIINRGILDQIQSRYQ